MAAPTIISGPVPVLNLASSQIHLPPFTSCSISLCCLMMSSSWFSSWGGFCWLLLSRLLLLVVSVLSEVLMLLLRNVCPLPVDFTEKAVYFHSWITFTSSFFNKPTFFCTCTKKIASNPMMFGNRKRSAQNKNLRTSRQTELLNWGIGYQCCSIWTLIENPYGALPGDPHKKIQFHSHSKQ